MNNQAADVINHMQTADIIEISCAILMGLGLITGIIQRVVSKSGIGARFIQYVAVVLIIPGIIILALEKAISSETTAALLGAITGYLLSGIGELKNENKP